MKFVLTIIVILGFYFQAFSFQDPFGASKNLVPKEKIEKYKGELSPFIRISSKYLGYDLQYRVYLPLGYSQQEGFQSIYLTDGPGYINKDAGNMVHKLDEMIEEGKIKPVIAIFIDARDPDNLSRNRRNSQYLVNNNYVDFVTKELVPTIDSHYNTKQEAKFRAIMGLSFGGLNAAYFGIKANQTFYMIGMQSPAIHPRPDIYEMYKTSDIQPIKIYLTTGTNNDTELATRMLKRILKEKGYIFKYKEVPEGHNWRNWKPLIDEALVYFFGTTKMN